MIATAGNDGALIIFYKIRANTLGGSSRTIVPYRTLMNHDPPR